MRSTDPISGFTGVVMIIAGSIVVSALISVVTGQLAHWLPLALGLLVGVWVVQIINR